MLASLLSDNAHNRRREKSITTAYPTRLRAIGGAATLILLLTGCGETWVEVAPVTGSIKIDGQSPEGARLTLNPVNPTGEDIVIPTAGVKADGSFTVTSYQSDDGAPPGEYVITIRWNKYDEKLGGAGPNVLPELYADPKTSPIKVTVNAGAPTTLEPITLTTKTARGASPARR
jgi:hypothetical protein